MEKVRKRAWICQFYFPNLNSQALMINRKVKWSSALWSVLQGIGTKKENAWSPWIGNLFSLLRIQATIKGAAGRRRKRKEHTNGTVKSIPYAEYHNPERRRGSPGKRDIHVCPHRRGRPKLSTGEPLVAKQWAATVAFGLAALAFLPYCFRAVASLSFEYIL